jgi:hypothetical protein
MILKRKALRDAIQRALDAHLAQFNTEIAEDKENERQERAAWLALNTATWRIALSSMNAKLTEGKVLVESDIPRDGRFAQSLVYRGSRHRHVASNGSVQLYQPPKELVALAAILDLSEDETVTTNALKQLGFASFRAIMPYLKPEDRAQ